MKKSIHILISTVFVTAFVTLFVSSCTKKENQAPVIAFVEPADGSVWQIDSTIHIEANLSDDESLHEMSVQIYSATDTVLEEFPVVHALKTKAYHNHISISTAGTYTVKITAEDHDGAQNSKQVGITVN